MSAEREMGWGRGEIYLFGVLNIRPRGFEGFSECRPFCCFDVDSLMKALASERGTFRDHVLASRANIRVVRGLIKFSVRNFIQYVCNMRPN